MKLCKPVNRLTILLSLLALLALTACGQSDEVANAELERPEKVVPVELELIAPLDLTETFTLPASLTANEDLVLSAEIAGPVKKFNYQEGSPVPAGAVLLEIDSETLQSNLRRDEDLFAVAKRKLKRYRGLAAEGLVSEQVLDELENGMIAAETGLQATRLQLARSYPKAPISGIVDQHFVDRGEFVDVGKALLRLVQVDKLKALADVPEKDIGFLRVGQEVSLVPATINRQAESLVKGYIESIAFTADDATRTYRAKIIIDNAAGDLRPGMILRAKFVRQQLRQVVSAPLYAVLDRDGQKVVFVEESGLARKIVVVTGNSVDQRIIITSGLKAGQKLIVKGQQLLLDGVKVAAREN